MHLHRTEPERLTGLLSLDDADHLLTSAALRTPAVRLARDGQVLPESRYTRRGASLAGKPLTGLLDPRRVLAEFDAGATVVFQGLHRYWPPLTELVATLELELGHPCQANAYLTPPGNQGFAVHSDSHDVFVFQTAGSKLWELHGPQGPEAHGPEGPEEHGPDGPEEVLLEPGLSMYLPTGTPHAARAQDTVSLHVTIGINQLTWRGLVRRTVQRTLDAVPDEHLPAGYVEDPDRRSRLAEGLAERLEALADEVRRLDAGEATVRETARFLSTRPARLPGGLRDALAVRVLAEDSTLRRRPGHPFVVVDGGPDRLRVLLGDRVLHVPARLRPALDELAARTAGGRTVTPADLADRLDPQSRLVLCRRLVREGLLEVVG